MDTINDILMRTSLLFIWAGSILGAIVGIAMLVNPRFMVNMNQKASRWVDTERVEVEIDKPRWTERFFYRYHRTTGAIFIIGGVVVFYTFLFSPSVKALAIILSKDSQWIASGLISALVIGSVTATFIGIMMFLRPSMLKEVEKHSNRWVSTDGLLQMFNGSHSSFDKFIIENSKISGLILLLGSAYIMFVLGYYLWWTKVAAV